MKTTEIKIAPIISIIIPAYNYAATLPRAIKSVLPQLTEQHELIIIDDGSTDDTPLVLEQLQKRYPTEFRSIRKKNGGPSSARNLGIQESYGQYLIFLDADDELTANALEQLKTHMIDQPKSSVIIAGHYAISADGKQRLHLPEDLPEEPLQRLRLYLINKRIAISHGACVMHREVYSHGNYPEAFRSAEDIPVFAQAVANFPCSILKQPLALIHKHDDSLRHQFNYAKAGGLALVDEVFSPQRLGVEFQGLKSEFYVKRCLSLFRSASIAGDTNAAKDYFRAAYKKDWRILLKGSYMRKALRLWLRK